MSTDCLLRKHAQAQGALAFSGRRWELGGTGGGGAGCAVHPISDPCMRLWGCRGIASPEEPHAQPAQSELRRSLHGGGPLGRLACVRLLACDA